MSTDVSIETHEQVIRTSDSNPSWVSVTQQDAVAPPGEFPMVRSLRGGPFLDNYNVCIDLYRSEPREYPPAHSGDGGGGINLDIRGARALRDALSRWIEIQERADHA